MNKLQRGGTGGSPLDDDSALMLMARHVLGGSRDEGRASFQIALSVCPGCGGGHQVAKSVVNWPIRSSEVLETRTSNASCETP